MEEVLARGRITKGTYLALIGRPFCREAAFIHCISEAEADAVRSVSGEVPAVIAPHGLGGVDVGSFDRGALCKESPHLVGKRIFGFLGRLDPIHKGLDLVVEACAQLRSKHDVAMVLAGPDWRDRTLALRKRVNELALNNVVLFIGPKMGVDKFNFLASLDVFVHPSRWEAGIPFSVLDALELAKPCLVTSGKFFSEFFQRHEAGIQVAPTKESVTQGLQYMVQATTHELQAMGAHGRKAVLREFSWKRSAQILLEAYASRGVLQSVA
jgi:glycosyltransferase involved in cell wall biosynthesis